MTTSFDIPMPAETLDGRTVIASMWMRDTEEPITALVILLGASPPYYAVAYCSWSGGEWIIDEETQHGNIIDAVNEYAE